MKRNFTLLVLLVLFAGLHSYSQVLTSDFEVWTNNKPAGWGGIKTNAAVLTEYAEYTTSAHGGTKAVQLKNTTTGHKRLSTTSLTVASNANYTITF